MKKDAMVSGVPLIRTFEQSIEKDFMLFQPFESVTFDIATQWAQKGEYYNGLFEVTCKRQVNKDNSFYLNTLFTNDHNFIFMPDDYLTIRSYQIESNCVPNEGTFHFWLNEKPYVIVNNRIYSFSFKCVTSEARVLKSFESFPVIEFPIAESAV